MKHHPASKIGLFQTKESILNNDQEEIEEPVDKLRVF